ncbi:MAG: hypothetical protein Q8P51_18420 [Ignavibacteria bacterium]|nr:hypothetical protein [Ignavibacteria bacterium]
MKLKTALAYLIGLALFASVVGCSKKPPSVRVFNERATKVNVQIKTSDNTINLNDVAAGQTTNYQDISEGPCGATAVIQNESVSPTRSFSAEKDNNYTVIVANTTPPTVRVDSQSK